MEDFERKIIDELFSGRMSSTIDFLQPSSEENIEYSGAGYFLTVKDPALPKDRVVLNEPDIRGQLDGIDVGYLAFIENHELTLECYSFGQEISDANRKKGFQRAKT